jgi:hypothetical protein
VNKIKTEEALVSLLRKKPTEKDRSVNKVKLASIRQSIKLKDSSSMAKSTMQIDSFTKK